LPAYKGADRIPEALDCLQRQTFRNFEVVISVDGNDTETADACRPFLADSRFRMVIHPKRLDWVGNFNWLLQQDLQEFFCYRQHDDTTAPEFFEALLHAADREPSAAAIYCDCQYSGSRSDREIAPSVDGPSLDRMLECIEVEWMRAVPVRGLIRCAAIRQAGLVRTDEFRALMEVFVWLAKLSRWGNFRRVAKPLYYRLAHPRNLSTEFRNYPPARKRAVFTTLFTGLLEAAMPLCRTPEQRLFFQQIIAVQAITFLKRFDSASSEEFLAECLERLRYEGNTHLLRGDEIPQILPALKLREEAERSQIGKVVYRIRRQAQMARFIYPTSQGRRVVYQIHRHVGRMWRKIRSSFD
jgi:hypothetical protein